MAEKKITKSQHFADISAMLHGEPVQYGTTLAIADEFISHEIDLLSRKNTAERKPTKEDEQNDAYRDLILAYLSTQTEGKTCTEIQRAIPEFAGFNNQKIAGLMRTMIPAKVSKAVIKGKSLFSIA